jgi:hypothetical protein
MVGEYSSAFLMFMTFFVCKTMSAAATNKNQHNTKRAFLYEFDEKVIPDYEMCDGEDIAHRPSFWIGIIYFLIETGRCMYITLWEFGVLYGGDAHNPYTIPTQHWNYMDVSVRWANWFVLLCVVVANGRAPDRSFVVINQYNIPLVCVPVPVQICQVALDLSTIAIYYLDRERFYVYLIGSVMIAAVFTGFQQTWAAFPYFSAVCKTVYWTIASFFYATVFNGATDAGTNMMTPDTGYFKWFPLTNWASRIATYTEHTVPMAMYMFAYTAMFAGGLSFIVVLAVVLYDGKDSLMNAGSSVKASFERGYDKIASVRGGALDMSGKSKKFDRTQSYSESQEIDGY